MNKIYLGIVLAPLLGAIIAGLFGKQIGRKGAHTVTIIGVAISFALSLYLLKAVVGGHVDNVNIYTWLTTAGVDFNIGFKIDPLSSLMTVVVTFVSLMVHIYTIGYMHDDPGYQRFFSYISLFTFSMLMLVMSNNFLQLFFGWEAVGVVSYLLIGFWFKKETAIFANLKAFLVNRVGDFGFLLGIAFIFMYTNTLDYDAVFGTAEELSVITVSLFPGHDWSLVTVICILLFIGAMGKSAQIPLHVWLPDSMEGPTPISALIHAATMVTAGIFMVARMSYLFEYSETALSFVMVMGGLTAILMGLIGIVQNDIKRVVAYSTLSQLGYMTVALGASAYAAGIFHLMTHAFFKALLFLAAGSVIIAMHHDQDIRNMGGLKKYMPITYWTSLIGSIALIGVPFTSGFYSKDAIIDAVHLSHLPVSGFIYYLMVIGVFITALYSFRMFFLVFHGKERMDEHTRSHLKETPYVVTVPLIMLAIPSLCIGMLTIGPVLFGGFFDIPEAMKAKGFLDSIMVLDSHNVLSHMSAEYHGVINFTIHGMMQPPFYFMLAGFSVAYYLYCRDNAALVKTIKERFSIIHTILDKKYGFDEFYQIVFASGSRILGKIMWKVGDVRIIDGLIVNGSAKTVGWFSTIIRHIQTGFLYHYAFAMIVGLMVLLSMVLYSNNIL